MKDAAIKYHTSGDSCSTSIIKAAIDAGFCDETLLSASFPFSGGCSSGCLCGAVAASLMVIGVCFKNNSKPVAAEFMEKFKAIHKVTCCRILSKGLEGSEKRKNCSNLVYDCAVILENLIKVKVQ